MCIESMRTKSLQMLRWDLAKNILTLYPSPCSCRLPDPTSSPHSCDHMRTDFGNFQDAEGKQKEKAERLRFGRFFYRFPNGESGADVYDRMTIFEDHLIRDINAGRYADGTSLVLVTHGLALRVLLMRWFHWSVDQFMNVFNPPNAEARTQAIDECASWSNFHATSPLFASFPGTSNTLWIS